MHDKAAALPNIGKCAAAACSFAYAAGYSSIHPMSAAAVIQGVRQLMAHEPGGTKCRASTSSNKLALPEQYSSCSRAASSMTMFMSAISGMPTMRILMQASVEHAHSDRDGVHVGCQTAWQLVWQLNPLHATPNLTLGPQNNCRTTSLGMRLCVRRVASMGLSYNSRDCVA